MISRKLTFVLILIAMALVGAIGDTFLKPKYVDQSASTYSSGPNGTKVLFLLMDELGINIKRLEQNFSNLDKFSGTLLVNDFPWKRFSQREIKQLVNWVESGNTLILIQGNRKDFLNKYDKHSTKDRQKIRSRIAEHFGLTLLNDQFLQPGNLTIKLPSSSRSFTIYNEGTSVWKVRGYRWTILARNSSGPVLVHQNRKKGQVFALSDPTIFSNRNIGKAENGLFALEFALRNKPDSKILFDEYHHGHITADSLSHFVSNSVFGLILLQLGLGALFYFYTRRGSIVGRYESLQPKQGRSTMEYVNSMAGIFATYRAEAASLDAILSRILMKLSRKAGTSLKNLDDKDLRLKLGRFEDQYPGISEVIIESRQRIRLEKKSKEILELADRLSELDKAIERKRAA